MIKSCPTCKQGKELDEFNNDKTRKDGKYPVCRKCRKLEQKRYRENGGGPTPEYKRQWRRNNPDKTKKTNRKQNLRKYGLTEEEYISMLESQNGKCAICGDKEPGRYKNFNIDHCHETGINRGLLCVRCNLGIGNLKDSPEILRKAAEYLDRFKK